jgi:tetratricopeptide (TPR) repeat protein
MHRAIRFVNKKEHQLERGRSLGRRVCPGLALLACISLLPVPSWSKAQTELDHVQRSVQRMSAGDLVAAEKEARLALRDPSTRAAAWATLGVIRVHQKRYAEATEFLRTALRLDPRSVGAHITLSEVYTSAGKKEKARELLQEALRTDPGNREGLFALAQLESKSGNFSASLSVAEPILADLRRSSAGVLLLAKNYAGLKQRESLASLVPDWGSLPEVSAASSTTFASFLIKSGLDQQALEVLEKAKASGQVSLDLALALGNLYFLKGDLSQAFDSYEAALSLKHGCIECVLQLAKIASQQKDPEKALAYLIKAKHEQPRNAEILFEFGKTCLQLDLNDDAISALQQAVRLQPNNDSYSYVLASAKVSRKQYEAAGKLFQGLLAKHPDDSVLNYAMGSLLFLEVRLDEAAEYLHRSVELQPDQAAAYYYLGLIAEGKGENDQAITILRDVLRRAPDYDSAYEALGRILLKEQKYPEAQQALERAVLLNPSSVTAHYQLGILFGRTGKQNDANRQFEIVHQLNVEEEKRAGMLLHILTPH